MRRNGFAAIIMVIPLIGCANTIGAQQPPETIDAVLVAPERFKLLLENDYVRVIEYSLAPGEKDTPHTHPPKVSYVISGGKLLIHPKEGEPFVSGEMDGAASWDEERGWHYVENIGETTVHILLVEVKSAATK